jgi:uridine phosphorylase
MNEHYEAAYVARSNEWLNDLAQSRAALGDACRYVILVIGSTEYGGNIAGCLDTVEARGAFIPEPTEVEQTQIMRGTYQGVTVGVWHHAITRQAFGASYTNMALDSLRGSSVEVVIAIGEMSSLQEHLRVGHLALPTAAIRGDDMHRYVAPPEEPAIANLRVSAALLAEARANGVRVQPGLVWGCGAGAGIYDPLLEDTALAYCRQGVLGNCMEVATTYLVSRQLGLACSSLWLVADSIYEPLTWTRPVMRQPWSPGWKTLVHTALNTCVRLDRQETDRAR